MADNVKGNPGDIYRQQELELNILRKVGKILSSELDIDHVLSKIIDACRELVSAEAWSILLKDPNEEMITFSRILGQKKNQLRDMSLKLGQGIAGKVAKTGKARIVNNVDKDPDFYPEIDKITGFKTRSILCIPLISRGKILGVIEIINKRKSGKFTRDDLKKVETYTEFASVALENAQLYEQALHSAITDDLTGLYNNRFINQKLSIELHVAKRKKQPLGFIFMDLDRFKVVNDKHGHMIGSCLLNSVALYFKEELKHITEMIARYGGDEFLVVLSGKNSEQTGKLAERLRKGLEKQVFKLDNNINVSITASFGVAAYPEQAKSIEDLIGMADKAMYEVKAENRNAVKIYTQD